MPILPIMTLTCHDEDVLKIRKWMISQVATFQTYATYLCICIKNTHNVSRMSHRIHIIFLCKWSA